jgi:hypothetical protein
VAARGQLSAIAARRLNKKMSHACCWVRYALDYSCPQVLYEPVNALHALGVIRGYSLMPTPEQRVGDNKRDPVVGILDFVECFVDLLL